MSKGDLRKCITILQSISAPGKPITAADVREKSGFIPDAIIRKLLLACESTDFNALHKLIKSFRADGYGVYQALLQLSDAIMAKPEISSTTKAQIFQKMGVSFSIYSE